MNHVAPSPPHLEFLFSLDVAAEVTGRIPNGPAGTRVVGNATGGSFDGPRLRGTIEPPGGDWVTVRADGSVAVDARLLFRTHDGAHVLMEYRGLTTPGAGSIVATPTFQTGAEAYAWLNTAVCVAVGTSSGGRVRYDVFAVRVDS